MGHKRKYSGDKPAMKSNDEVELVDRISSLPDEILVNILSFVHPKCAVGTSLLSRRWRYLFRFITKLHFDGTESSIRRNKNYFKKFVHLFLQLHQAPSLKEFGLKCYYSYDTSDIDVWISAAILKQVEEIYIWFRRFSDRKGQQRLPFSLFNCKSLQVLKIDASIGLVVPKTICLNNLKVLDFTHITFVGEESIGRLLSGCRSLQVLKFNACEFVAHNECFFICSSSLEYLTFEQTSYTKKFEIDAPSLQNATFKEHDDTYFWCTDNNNSLKIESSPTYLCLDRNTFGHLAAYKTPAHLNLALLILGWSATCRWKELINLLCNSPRLETVIFYQGLYFYFKDEDRLQLEEWLKEPKVASLSLHMEFIEVHWFSGANMELFLLERLLQMAIKLKRLILYRDGKVKAEHGELKTAKQLLMLPRTSHNCRIELV